ncbi:MAG: SpoIID/LytB domain-containing protein [Bacteroidota bacterium]
MALDPLITVGVVSAPSLAFEFTGRYAVADTSQFVSGQARAFRSGPKIVFECGSWCIESPQEILLTAADAHGPSFTIRDVTIGVGFHWERKEDQRFLGALKLVPTGDTVTAINVVSVEDYLASVISSEMSASSSANLLEAHAIASRSWLLAQLERLHAANGRPSPHHAHTEDDARRIRWYDREDHDLFDVCADDHCQRYQGITRAYSASVQRAVEKTRGMVVMYNGVVCDARFSKCCGGLTEPFELVWEPVHHPYLVCVADRAAATEVETVSDERRAQAWIRSTPEAFCNSRDRRTLAQVLVNYDQETPDFFRWQVSYGQEELADLIRTKSGIDFGAIRDLIPLERGPSGRICLLEIVGDRKTMAIGKELEIRRTLSPSHLYSSAFVVDKVGMHEGVPGRFLFTGAGWGHGVGMCQIGAAVMGELGYSADQILHHYFKATEIHCAY